MESGLLVVHGLLEKPVSVVPDVDISSCLLVSVVSYTASAVSVG